MDMSYQKFISYVPIDTKEYVDNFLKLYKWYIIDKNISKTKFKNEKYETQIFVLLLSAKYKNIFAINGNVKNIESLEEVFEDNFSELSDILCDYPNLERYVYLTPERIILNYLRYNIDYYDQDFLYDISYSEPFKMKAEKYVYLAKNNLELMSSEHIIEKNVEIEFFKNLSYELIVFLRKSAEIFEYFCNHSIGYDNKLISTNSDACVASMLISISLMDNVVSSYLKSIGIDQSIINETFNMNYYKDFKFDVPSSYVALLKAYFNDFVFGGKNENIERTKLAIENVISNIFDSNFTNSRVVDAVLYKLNLSSDDFFDFPDKVKLFEKNYLILKEEQEKQEFYGNIHSDVVKFLEFVYKTYTVIKNNEIYRNNIIKNENDFMILSIFISSYFFNNSYVDYFKNNGISYEKLINCLEIKITKKQIETINPSLDILKIYKEIIFATKIDKGNLTIDPKNNKQLIFATELDKEKVTINNILGRILNSECIYNLINQINPNMNLKSNLVHTIESYNCHKEELRKYELEQKFFGDMPKETIEYIKEAEKIHQFISEYKENIYFFTDDDLIQISLFLTLIGEYRLNEKYDELTIKSLDNMYKNIDIKKYPEFDKILHEFGIVDSIEYNIDFIYNNFGKYVFGGNNKNKEKKNIEIKDIFTNIFGCSFSTSTTLNKFLFDIEFDKSKLKNYDEYFINFKEEKFIEKVKNKIRYNSLTDYYEDLSKIYQILKEIGSENNNINNIEDSSQLLACFIKGDPSNLRISLLKNRKINLESYLKYLNISNEKFDNYKNKEVNYHIIDEKFSQFYNSAFTFDNILMFLFGKLSLGSEQHNKFVDYIKWLNQSPNIVEEEMESGKEVIVPMTQDEQIRYFNNLPINKLEFNIPAISSFGKDLSEHSFVIADEYLKIALMDSDENSVICNIQQELDKINIKPEKKLFFRKKISGTEKIEQNKTTLNNLNKFLEEKEDNLYKQIEHFEYLKKLIAIYIYRLNNYILELENVTNNFHSKKNHFENIDTEIIEQISNDKLLDFKKALILSTEQYQKINLLLRTHAITLSKISTYKNTIIPNLYIELSIKDGIISEKESLESLKKISDLLDNMVSNNNQLLNQKDFSGNLSKNAVLGLSDETKKSIECILENEQIKEFDNQNINPDDDIKKLIKK